MTQPKSDNAMRMQMDPPTDRLRVVTGPPATVINRQMRAVAADAAYAQALHHARRGDAKHAIDYARRSRALRDSLRA